MGNTARVWPLLPHRVHSGVGWPTTQVGSGRSTCVNENAVYYVCSWSMRMYENVVSESESSIIFGPYVQARVPVAISVW